MMEQGKVHTPPAWITASLKNDWQPARDMPSDLTPQVLTFRVDESTFAQIERETCEEKTTATNK